MDDWNHPEKKDEELFIAVRSRMSAVLLQVFNHKDVAQNTLEGFLIAGFGIFVLVEIVSVVIGIGMTRTITGAVHRLYEGTQRVIAGDFSHRIEVTGNDQLAELSHSFNRMTEHLEQLLVVAKEKERLESEIEIAREVQSQLFPREVPELRTLRIKAVCQPARLVSGDYYDFEMVGDSRSRAGDRRRGRERDFGGAADGRLAKLVADSIADARWRCWPAAETVTWERGISTSRLVSNLNRQLHSTTSAEKYATFLPGRLR